MLDDVDGDDNDDNWTIPNIIDINQLALLKFMILFGFGVLLKVEIVCLGS